jgi:hypothetical protein
MKTSSSIKDPIITWYNNLSIEDHLWKAWVCFHSYEILFIYFNAAAEIDLNIHDTIVISTIDSTVISPLLQQETHTLNRRVRKDTPVHLDSALQIWSNKLINILRLQQISKTQCQGDSIYSRVKMKNVKCLYQIS